jgi:hypothetical protein
LYHGNPSTKLSVAGSEQETVDLLYAENVKSVNHRYKGHDDTIGAVYDNTAPNLSALEMIKACQCLAYQSNEHPEWGTSTAKALLDQLQVRAIAKLPGYDAAPWRIE